MPLPDLFVSLKEKAGKDPSAIPEAFRQVERWVKTVSSSVGAAYASLTGAGQTVTPGDLIQAGGFEVNDLGGSAIGIRLQSSSASGITVAGGAGGGGVGIGDVSFNGITLNTTAGPGSITSESNSGTFIRDSGSGTFISGTGAGSLVSIRSGGTAPGGTAGSVAIQFSASLNIKGPGTAAFSLFVSAGSPNLVVTANAKGDLCIDTSTPGIWQATAAGNASWTQYTFP